MKYNKSKSIKVLVNNIWTGNVTQEKVVKQVKSQILKFLIDEMSLQYSSGKQVGKT